MDEESQDKSPITGDISDTEMHASSQEIDLEKSIKTIASVLVDLGAGARSTAGNGGVIEIDSEPQSIDASSQDREALQEKKMVSNDEKEGTDEENGDSQFDESLAVKFS